MLGVSALVEALFGERHVARSGPDARFNSVGAKTTSKDDVVASSHQSIGINPPGPRIFRGAICGSKELEKFTALGCSKVVNNEANL